MALVTTKQKRLGHWCIQCLLKAERKDDKTVCAADEDYDEEVNETRFEFLLQSGVQLVDYVAIDDVAVAVPLNDDDILTEVLEENQNHCFDGDD